jgi:hypothetical protein
MNNFVILLVSCVFSVVLAQLSAEQHRLYMQAKTEIGEAEARSMEKKSH